MMHEMRGPSAIHVALATALLLLAAPEGAHGQSRFTVDLRAVAADAEADFLSLCGRQLRSLGDVTVSATAPDWVVYFVALEDRAATSGASIGYSAAFTVTESIHGTIERLGDDPISAERVAVDNQDIRVYRGMWLYSGGRREIGRICESFVIDFDTQLLEPARRIRSGDRRF